MYEEHCRGFNFVGLAIQRDIKLLFRQNIVIAHTNLPFGKICINLPRRTPQAICSLTVPILAISTPRCGRCIAALTSRADGRSIRSTLGLKGFSRTNSFGSPVIIVQVCNHSPFAGSFQPSHDPANTKGESSFMLIEYGILPPGTFHS